MSWEHERVEELLAGHVLDALDPGEARLAARALEEHVPSCPACRESLQAFRTVAGDLGLAASPVPPPQTLRARLRRVTRGAPVRRLHPAWAAAAVAVAGLAGIAAWNVSLAGRLDRSERAQAEVVHALGAVTDPQATAVPLEGPGGRRATIVMTPGRTGSYLLVSGLPETDEAYQVWLVSDDGSSWSPGTFVPRRGVAMVALRTDMARWRTVMITHAPAGGAPRPLASPLVSAGLR